VSAFPVDGTWPTGTAQWEKRNIAIDIPVWDPKICIQCNKCAMVCPHAAIRAKVYESDLLKDAPETFKSMDFKGGEFKGMKYTIQVAPEDCTGCSICVSVCPAKDKSNPKHKSIDMAPQRPLREAEVKNYDFFLALPEVDRGRVKPDVKGSQFFQPLFEYSGACAACGETPYVKLLTQLFGDRLMVGNATGCSSIYGGNLPTSPYAKNPEGRGPAWSNSLFEDNAEFGFGFRLAIDKNIEQAQEIVRRLAPRVGAGLAEAILGADQTTEAGIAAQRERVAALRGRLAGIDTVESRWLEQVVDSLVKKRVWIVGGDGWAYDIGYGGLDHVIAQGRNVNILVLDTEVYSNTGGQASKSTPIGAVAKFAFGGKARPKKDLAMMAMAYGTVYVARVSLANPLHLVRTMLEAEAYSGPSLIICYAHCIAHGIDTTFGVDEQKKAVNSGHWILMRYNPALAAKGENPLKIDSKPPTISFEEYAYGENRYRVLKKINPDAAVELMALAEQDTKSRWELYQQLAGAAASE
ncbi:MAG: 4Fe-4S dicluster domain-containing protein, partial [Acidobacteria bacterium]